MSKRGRPPYPDILTPREWEVLALLREELSNEQIAERLGISLAGAKYHVSEILGKPGVATREEAARWRPQERPWWLGGLVPLTFWRRLGWLPQVVVGAAAIAIAAGIGLMVWALVRTEGHDETTNSVSVLTTRAATATVAQPTPEVPIGQVTVLATGNAGGMDWSPDGRSVAYSVDGTLYRADAPSLTPYVLAAPNDELLGLYDPRWSPDGTRIAFTSNHPGRFGDPDSRSETIGLVNADGTGLRDLLPGVRADLAPTNSKGVSHWLDNQTLVFYQGCGTACRLPYVIDVDAGSLERGVRSSATTGLLGAGILGTLYSWSPNGRWIAAYELGPERTITLHDRRTQETKELATASGFEAWTPFGAAWSPDSNEFLFEQPAMSSTARVGTIRSSVHVYDVSTGISRLLAESGRQPSWSQDGSRFGYLTDATDERPCSSTGMRSACIVVADASSGEELYRLSAPGYATIAFLPDNRLVYSGFEGRELLMAADGESQSLAAVNGMREFRVSPDSRYVLTSEPGLQGRILLIAIPGEDS